MHKRKGPQGPSAHLRMSLFSNVVIKAKLSKHPSESKKRCHAYTFCDDPLLDPLENNQCSSSDWPIQVKKSARSALSENGPVNYIESLSLACGEVPAYGPWFNCSKWALCKKATDIHPCIRIELDTALAAFQFLVRLLFAPPSPG